ncbi:HAD family hydrolase [Entomoplasma ellychniae]|uniref:HAD family hydrolase n=1 Tax=Entomoplasma ellychniae TaxID=2114 RepID=A0A8E2UAH5_9MOLU|nr:HAD family hydrolase [Entomoplasma ellychniae]PPE04410.1 HAD family hydrolase [Entomoplasma ellychniae]
MKLNNIKLIATDLDGTILNHGKISNKLDVEMLKLAAEQGIHVVVSTGQGWSSAKPRAEMFNVDKYSNLSVFFNGAVISEIKEYNPIYCQSIDSKLVEEFMKMMSILDVACLAYTKIPAHAYWNGIDIKVESMVKRNWVDKYNTEKVDVLTFKNYIDVVQLMIFVEEEQERLLLEWINKNNLTNKLNHMRSNVESTPIYEFIHIESNKGYGVLKLAEILNIDKEDILIFGDNLNDISMFEMIPNSVAMGNAVELIKQKAKYITDTNMNGGVGQFIKAHIIKE